ncbi:PEP-CTERM sorting domain-containing protein [Massilia forsythiae]|uniref:PEP-CTERM sorting domain-containing protein n=1 Tax=Massilia forsythiae TaxID=2728020 RepID=A0A7Z2VWU3_9BURK|nr:PEP-CTERM sorting domain-containing protein [Massilia forsythiae]QJE00827.1 PEP-CTERM sorting domain-containing protein [Massilia forsythiae]
MKAVVSILATGLALSLSAGANASVVKYAYKAKVSSIREKDIVTGNFYNVDRSDFAEKPVAIGDIITGFFQYDTDVPLSRFQPQQTAGSEDLSYDSGATDFISYYDTMTGLAFESMLSLNWLGATFVTNSAPAVGTYAYAPDTFDMKRSAYGDVFYKSAYISLYNFRGNVFDNASIPASLSLASFSYAHINSSFLRTNDDGFMMFSSDLTALEQVDVPEPSSTMLFAAAGLALFGLRRKRG